MSCASTSRTVVHEAGQEKGLAMKGSKKPMPPMGKGTKKGGKKGKC